MTTTAPKPASAKCIHVERPAQTIAELETCRCNRCHADVIKARIAEASYMGAGGVGDGIADTLARLVPVFAGIELPAIVYAAAATGRAGRRIGDIAHFLPANNLED